MGKWLLIVASLALCCCGVRTRPCIDPSAGDGGALSVVSPALECPSKLCLVTHRDGGAIALCTAECSSDRDCGAMGMDYCASGYACGAVADFPHAVCVCRDSLAGGL